MTSVIGLIKQYWRIYMMVVIALLSLGIIFSPVLPITDIGSTEQQVENPSLDQQYTGLQYGIELAGGTRIRAPLYGVTAEEVDIGSNFTNGEEVESAIADELSNTSPTEVNYIEPSDPEEDAAGNSQIEVVSREAEIDTVREAIDSVGGISYDTVRPGVTSSTREKAIEVLQNKLDAAGLTGSSVRAVDTSSERQLILVEVPDVNRERTVELITERGEVRIDIYHPTEDGEYETEVGVLEQDDFRSVGSPQAGADGQGPHVPVSLTSTAADRFVNETVRTGVAQPGGSTCQYDVAPNQTQSCLLTVVDGEVVYSAGMAPSLADNIRVGSWNEEPSFILQTETLDESQELAVNLRAGVLPSPMNLDQGGVSFVSPTQGDTFRYAAGLTGILAILALGMIVYLRYGRAKIAAPMLVTATVEIIILLAVAVLLKYPIDIAVVAGFVAVLGTGVDDLIIIADRVIGGDNPASHKNIFQKRFRKALWIILGAAGTTILALSPLALLDLQALQGFAIFTILGVIVGVLITRPAYGNILEFFYTNN